MYKFLILICLIFSLVQSIPRPFRSLEEALEFEKSQYDFNSNYNKDLKLFENFKAKFNKKYENNGEEQKRFKIFRNNLLKIKLMNSLEKGTAVYKINHFSDLDDKEFKQRYTGLKIDKSKNFFEFSDPEFDMNAKLPKSFDWREKGVVSEVKNQLFCGSCWAFAVTAAIESQNKIVNGKLITLSEQQLVDCDTGDFGCNGGWMYKAYEYLLKSGGLESDKDYVYTQNQDECKFKKSLSVVQIEKYVNITQDEDAIAQYLVQKGPISVGVNSLYMRDYSYGVSDPNPIYCDPKEIDHAVLIVGFGEKKRFGKDPIKYWIIKNSWGKSYGEDGYYYLVRGKNACGIRELASAPIVRKN